MLALQVWPKAADHLVHQHPLSPLVGGFHRLQHTQADAGLLPGADQRLDVLGEATAAVALARVQEACLKIIGVSLPTAVLPVGRL